MAVTIATAACWLLFLSSAATAEETSGRAGAASSQPEIRAVWASTLAPAMNSPQEIQELVAAARRANLNTIIAQVRHRGVVFYRSDVEPLSHAVQGAAHFDPLAMLLREAHDTSGGKRRIDVYAWFNVFKLGTTPGAKKETSVSASTLETKLKGWLSTDTTGTIQDFLDPALPEVQDHLISLVEECVRKYKIDGVNLDYIRYPEEEAGYHQRAIERFNRLTGHQGVPAPKDAGWNAFRRDQITAFVRRCSATTWRLRPDCLVSVNAVGFGGPPRRDFSDSAPYRQVHQDWAGWIREGCVDAVTRMGYKREHVPQHAKDFRAWADFSKRLQEESPSQYVTLGVGGYFNELPGVKAQYQVARERGLGTSIFSYNTPLKESGGAREHGGESPFWDTMGAHIYPHPVPPVRPAWRRKIGIICGTLENADGKALDTVPVKLKGTDYETKTDGSGFFLFTGLPAGSYLIEAPSSPMHERRVEVSAGEVKQVEE